MNKYWFNIFILNTFIFSIVACATTPIINNPANISESHETLYIYDDGRMALNSRYLDKQDVVIYSDGRGGEKAAVKVHFPLHSNFYRDSIVVVRVENKFEESIGQR
jgi:hypothetical protein